jgi:hypothetical protein
MQRAKQSTNAAAYSVQDPDPTHLSPTQIDREIDLITQALVQYAVGAREQSNLTRNFPDFPPATTTEDEARIWQRSLPPNFTKSFNEMFDRGVRYEKEHHPPSQSEP